MDTRTRIAVAAVAGVAALLGPAAAQATALPLDGIHITGQVIPGGADGQPHELFCPAPQSAYSGGFAISASEGARLAPEPTDVIESHPNANATGWIVTVRKHQFRSGHPEHPDHPGNPDHPDYPDYPEHPEHPEHPERSKDPHVEPADLVIHLTCTEGMPTHGM
ncbi:hypothetical protein J7E97_22510 [Streptomyces sp. ISL-66]|uniref:hypothetical protein n=1 Tax=Streptomyces sp. ISL-66 TaxID=2819186 RepID=UPI001BE9E366|nr:hypothetical protein [Streptomyces sp. ISL-66]MBT2470563.1 hypothetical protein [Streptomyces sp. ISL-66]